MSGYLLLYASESGRPVKFLSPRELQELLADPQSYCGVTEFTGPEQLGTDPNYWTSGLGVLLRYEEVIPIPAGSYRLPDDER